MTPLQEFALGQKMLEFEAGIQKKTKARKIDRSLGFAALGVTETLISWGAGTEFIYSDLVSAGHKRGSARAAVQKLARSNLISRIPKTYTDRANAQVFTISNIQHINMEALYDDQ